MPNFQARCCHCEDTRDMVEVVITSAANSRKMARGKCSECGRFVCTFVRSDTSVE